MNKDNSITIRIRVIRKLFIQTANNIINLILRHQKKNTVLLTTIQKERHNTINELSFYEKTYISHSSTNKLDTSSNNNTINNLSNISATYKPNMPIPAIIK